MTNAPAYSRTASGLISCLAYYTHRRPHLTFNERGASLNRYSNKACSIISLPIMSRHGIVKERSECMCGCARSSCCCGCHESCLFYANKSCSKSHCGSCTKHWMFLIGFFCRKTAADSCYSAYGSRFCPVEIGHIDRTGKNRPYKGIIYDMSVDCASL